MSLRILLAIFLIPALCFSDQETEDTLPENLADQTGWLVYDDGNKVSGRLVSSDTEGGVFLSDRFGEVNFSTADARFQQDLEDAFVPVPTQEIAPPETTSAPAITGVEPEPKKMTWLPDSWHIDGSLSWKSSDTDKSTQSDLEFGAVWQRDYTTSRLTLRNKYVYKNNKPDTNEQSLRFRWIRDTTPLFYVMFDGYGERDQTKLLGEELDYFLSTFGGGGGVHFQWQEKNLFRSGLLYEWFYADLLDFDTGSVESNAVSVFLSFDFEFNDRLSLHQWAKYYFWAEEFEGFESEIDLNYRLTEHLSVGLRHLYQQDSPTLTSTRDSDFRVYTRLKF